MQPTLQAWLRRQCESDGPTACGTLWARKAGGPPELVATHPSDGDSSGGEAARVQLDDHVAAATAADAASRPLVTILERTDLLAVPHACGGRRLVAVLEKPTESARRQALALDRLRHAMEWLDWALALPTGAPDHAETAEEAGPAAASPPAASEDGVSGSVRAVDLLAVALEPRPFDATARAVTTELAELLCCVRVSLARCERGRVVLEAISHGGRVDPVSPGVRNAVAAMQEAIDQGAAIAFPPPGDAAPLVVEAHRGLAASESLEAVWTLPLREAGSPCGALLFEFGRDGAPPDVSRAWAEEAARLLGPALAVLRRDQATPLARLSRLVRDVRPRALDGAAGRTGLAAAAAAVAALVVLAVVPGTHRVAAPASVERVDSPGDPSPAGADPVERGAVGPAFAPEDDPRIRLEVDGRDVAFLEAGQAGRLTLDARPGRPVPFTVTRVAAGRDGASPSRVEARLDAAGAGLEPGMRGRAEVDVGRRSLLWMLGNAARESLGTLGRSGER